MDVIDPVDHLVYAVPDLATGVAYVEDLLHIDAQHGGRHPHFGTSSGYMAGEGDKPLEMGANRSVPDSPEHIGTGQRTRIDGTVVSYSFSVVALGAERRLPNRRVRERSRRLQIPTPGAVNI